MTLASGKSFVSAARAAADVTAAFVSVVSRWQKMEKGREREKKRGKKTRTINYFSFCFDTERTVSGFLINYIENKYSSCATFFLLLLFLTLGYKANEFSRCSQFAYIGCSAVYVYMYVCVCVRCTNECVCRSACTKK